MMTTYPWRRAISQARSFVQRNTPSKPDNAPHVHVEARRNVISARAAAVQGARSNPKISPEDATSIALGVTFSVLVLALIGLACWYFLIRKPKNPKDVEAQTTEKRNWWMVGDSKGEKGTLSEWWRKSYAVPDRVEPPPSAGPRTSLQRLRSVLTRKGALRGVGKKNSVDEEQPPATPQMKKLTSPTMTIVLPMQTEVKPRYPSILERGYRVPLYPIQSLPNDNAPPRSLTSPAPPPPPPHPITVAERTLNTRRKVSVPPRALKISNGRPLISLAERKMGLPRSPATRRRGAGQAIGQFKHPFIPLKDSDTDIPTISAPMPSTENAETNPKLGYAYSMSRPRNAPVAPAGPRVSTRSSRATRRVPVPIFIQSPNVRPLMPATPRHLREETKVFPPGQSPSVPRPAPTPI
ncbi:hypothetical protein CC1G_00041 [Coprinopsis cinerea okayama7|uniref:Uncharacterized protein n=1 Tax=Coprinopsis cinerea (strain Okayama-7 / 130 / ATCC MYA-4618 / FGSC 9003) TaxID=240176 RepID=A8NWJ1_COPC7|nr:hypothetical protein CC1G_00041 [Coprinopsis cinerea okayama7\|eukprot:XP_001836905.1 hypothetical protein CC1G_00041 [Coprinopsis cinerea okayama7\